MGLRSGRTAGSPPAGLFSPTPGTVWRTTHLFIITCCPSCWSVASQGWGTVYDVWAQNGTHRPSRCWRYRVDAFKISSCGFEKNVFLCTLSLLIKGVIKKKTVSLRGYLSKIETISPTKGVMERIKRQGAYREAVFATSEISKGSVTGYVTIPRRRKR